MNPDFQLSGLPIADCRTFVRQGHLHRIIFRNGDLMLPLQPAGKIMINPGKEVCIVDRQIYSNR